ncbi:MAG: 4-alpha-glucanotransferase [Bacteroidia bacterium]|nr:4-alpha-glucanotransferase [Bacteroidia bacterium]
MSLIKFQISYHTNFGQEVYICGSTPELGNLDEANAIQLTCKGETWFAEIEMKSIGQIEYFYLLKEHGKTIRKEWGEYRKLYITKSKNFFVQDLWKNKPFHSYLYSSAFTESIFAHEETAPITAYFSNTILLNVICPFVKKGQKLVVSGEIKEFGQWDLDKALSLDFAGNGEWQILMNAKNLPDELHYKFVIVDEKTNEAVYWEDGGNRILLTQKAKEKNSVLVEMGLEFHYSYYSFKGTGTAIPVFSLRSDESFGIGDFIDLKKMIDWAALTNQQLIQMLPINDTITTQTWKDSYPYSAISCYALHPIYLGLTEFPLKNKTKMKSFLKEAKELNKLAELDYEKVLSLKKRYTEQLFEQEKNNIFASEAYQIFYKKNRFWLFSYTAYCYLRDKTGTAQFSTWGEFSVYNEKKLQKLIDSDSDAKNITDYYAFLQYLLDKQLSQVQEYAHKKGVALKGDIPIGINRDSIDAWTMAHLFNMDTQTGAPPDDFSFFGQNWGFPTYNWFAIEQEGYAWWKNRFRKMADYFDAYRIDHILGFFRIWEIPLHSVQGLLGHFSPALPYWSEELNMVGIPFDEERMTKPFIHEAFLSDIFGEYTAEVIKKYLDVSAWQRFNLKKEYDTQQKIQQYFSKKTDEKSLKIRDGLYALCNEVLFVRDRVNHNRFHPRITAQYSYSYQYLDDNVKGAFNRLYDDFFYHRHNYYWREQAMKKLPELISSTPMLVCGEDLGMVPDCVHSVMNELQILSLEIQRMPKNVNVLFSDLNSLPYLSVATTSTHDMSPIRLWWEENKEIIQKYYNEILNREGKAPSKCTPELCQQIVQQHLSSTAMWVILPWQDWISVSGELSRENPCEERINIPANPEHYWRYRMHISLDDLLKETAFNTEIKKMANRM